MKTLKTILAWLDWSSYARSHYSFPESLCSLFWRSLFAVLMAPFTWQAHLWNMFFCTKNNFKNEFAPDNKLYSGVGLVLHLLWMMLGGFAWKLTDGSVKEPGPLHWDLFHIADGFIINYGKLLLGGLCVAITIAIALGLIIIVIAGIRWLVLKIYEKLTVRKEIIIEENQPSYINYEPSALAKGWDAFKNKYCPRIDWSDIKNTTK